MRALGVSEAAARKDAEGVEHHVSAETIDIMRAFVDRNEPMSDA